jgi:hypothetical protein
MTTYNANYILELERLLDCMALSATSLLESREQVKMVRDIQHIMAEVRVCSQVLNLPDEVTRPDSLKAKAIDRLADIFENYSQANKPTAGEIYLSMYSK